MLTYVSVDTLRVSDYRRYFTPIRWIRMWNRITTRINHLDISNLHFPTICGLGESDRALNAMLLPIIEDSEFNATNNIVKIFTRSRIPLRPSFEKFFYIPWNSKVLSETLSSLTLDFPKHSCIHPKHFSYFKNLSRVVLNFCTYTTFWWSTYNVFIIC